MRLTTVRSSTSARYHGVLAQLLCNRLQVYRTGVPGRCEDLEHSAIMACRVTLAIDPEEARAFRGCDCSLHDTGAVDEPALARHLRECPGEGRGHRAHEIVDLPGSAAPVDPAIFGPPPPEVLAGLDRLFQAGLGAGQEQRQGSRQHDFRR